MQGKLEYKKDYWSWITENFKIEDIAKSSILMWQIWNFRNNPKTLNNPHSNSAVADKLIKAIEGAISEWEDSHRKEASPRRSGNQVSHVQWKPPAANGWKLNSDASWFDGDGIDGIGSAVHDSNGSLICFEIQRVSSKWGIKVMEAKAILEGIKAINHTCIQKKIPVEIESDSLEVIRVLRGDDEDLSELKPVVEEILCMSSKVVSTSFVHCDRHANTVAHWLARKAKDFVFSDQANPDLRDFGQDFWAPHLPCTFSLLFYEGGCFVG